MAELFVLAIGLILTGILALIKVLFVIAAMTWFWVWVPFFISFLLMFGIWLPDLSN